jgi:hypothetical protein
MRSFIASLLLVACNPIMPFQASAPAPEGLMCDRIIVPPKSLSDTLAAAKAGDCIILPSGTWSGSFVLPENVSLAASEGADVTLTGGDPVLTIKGGKRSTVQGVRVVATGLSGVAIEPGPVSLIGVKVAQAQRNALSATCTKDCVDRDVVLTDCELTQSAVGLRVVGAKVRVERGRIAEAAGKALSAGSGVVASDGANVSLKSVAIEQNENIGVLLDGAADAREPSTAAPFAATAAAACGAQGQTAPEGEATVTVTGGEVSGNSLIGIGARESSGLVIRQAQVLATKAVRVPIDISRFEDVGDGIGLFTGTHGATVEAVVLTGNARAQVLADGSGDDVKVSGTMSGGRLPRRRAAPARAGDGRAESPRCARRRADGEGGLHRAGAVKGTLVAGLGLFLLACPSQPPPSSCDASCVVDAGPSGCAPGTFKNAMGQCQSVGFTACDAGFVTDSTGWTCQANVVACDAGSWAFPGEGCSALGWVQCPDGLSCDGLDL